MSKRIGLIGNNSIEYVAQLIQIWNQGHCAVLIDWRIPMPRVQALLWEAGCDRCYRERGLKDEPEEDRAGSRIEWIPYDAVKDRASALPEELYRQFNRAYGEDEAVILFSSGTTGTAKGIILSHRAIQNNADAIIEYMDFDENDCIYIAKTLSHASALVGELLVGLTLGLRVVIAPVIVPPRYVFGQIRTFHVTHLCINPTLLALYVPQLRQYRDSISCLKSIYVNGAPLMRTLAAKAREALGDIPLFNSYGLTEAAPRVTAQTAGRANKGSVGAAIKGVQIRIEDDTGTELQKNRVGGIHVKTSCLFSGYASGAVVAKVSRGGWLDTGDMGYLDGDEQLHVIGRRDDVILNGAHNIHPLQVEQVLLEHPLIDQCAVFGHADPLAGERVVCMYTCTHAQDLSGTLYGHCLERLAPYEIPSDFVRVAQIPRTMSMKVSRRLLAQRYQAILKEGRS